MKGFLGNSTLLKRYFKDSSPQAFPPKQLRCKIGKKKLKFPPPSVLWATIKKCGAT